MKPSGWRARLRALKRDSLTVYFAARDPRLPWAVRLLALAIAAYALSPIDLIPDFIPVLGYLDDLILIPLGVALVVRLTPPAILADARARAERVAVRPVSIVAAVVISTIWLLLLAAGGLWWWRRQG
ncbi:MAG: YkvA family protein [Lysobacter sp.]